MSLKVLALVEGQTEEVFIKNALNPYLQSKGIFLIPIIIKTKREIRGPVHKGGINSYNQVKRDLQPLFNDSSADLVTTMIDYYGLPSDFPGYNQRPNGNCYQRVKFMEEQFKADINKKNFLPYLQLHEFEALVFASEEFIPIAFPNQNHKIQQINRINNSVKSPEEINENPNTAPSKRLKKIFHGYQKILHSQLILSKADINELRDKCPHFNCWLTKLES